MLNDKQVLSCWYFVRPLCRVETGSVVATHRCDLWCQLCVQLDRQSVSTHNNSEVTHCEPVHQATAATWINASCPAVLLAPSLADISEWLISIQASRNMEGTEFS